MTDDPSDPSDPSDYFDAAADAFLAHHLLSAVKLLFRVVYHAAAIALGLRIAKWYFDNTRALADERFAYLLLSAVGAVPFVLAVPLYGLVVSYTVRRVAGMLSRGVASLSNLSQPSYPPPRPADASQRPGDRDERSQANLGSHPLTVPLLAAIALLTLALLLHSPSPTATTSPNPLLPPFPLTPAPRAAFDPTALRYELHADVHATVQLHLADLRRELVAQSACHAKAVAELTASLKRVQNELETLQALYNRSVTASLQSAVEACSVAKVAELAAAAVKWANLL